MLQKLQTFPRVRHVEAHSYDWWNPNDELRDLRGRSFVGQIPRLEYLVPAAAGLLILGLLVHPAGSWMVALAIVAAVFLPWAIHRTSHHVSWLLIVLAAIEGASASSFIATSDQPLGAFIRYPLGLLFVLPFLPSVWRSGILRKGGFRDYTIYLIWAMVSASYSILPAVSFIRAIAAILPFCALCAIAVEIRSGDDARRVMGVLLAGCGAVVAVNYLALLIPTITTWQPDPESGMLRFAGYFTEPNEIGGLMLATLGAGFCYWPAANRSRKALAAVAMLGAVVQAALADSRSPFVAIAISGAVYLVLKYGFKGVLAVTMAFAIFSASAHAVPSVHEYLDRGDVASFTGRQVAWDFAVNSVKESPLVGYGYEVEGQILQSQYFQGWDEVWALGYQTSLHEGYLSRAISLGVPALLFWLFLTLRPVVSCFRRDGDPWRLRSIVPLALLPVLILNFTESISDFRSFTGVVMALAWTMLERERLFAKEQAANRAKAVEETKAPIVRALQAGRAW